MEQKQTAEALRESEARFRNAFDYGFTELKTLSDYDLTKTQA